MRLPHMWMLLGVILSACSVGQTATTSTGDVQEQGSISFYDEFDNDDHYLLKLSVTSQSTTFGQVYRTVTLGPFAEYQVSPGTYWVNLQQVHCSGPCPDPDGGITTGTLLDIVTTVCEVNVHVDDGQKVSILFSVLSDSTCALKVAPTSAEAT